jgi:hypothetical protein
MVAHNQMSEVGTMESHGTRGDYLLRPSLLAFSHEYSEREKGDGALTLLPELWLSLLHGSDEHVADACGWKPVKCTLDTWK